MTITTTSSAVTLLGNGSTSVFNFSFVAGAASNIVVTYTNAAGAAMILAPSQYSLVINPPAAGQIWGYGGTVTYPLTGSPIASGTSLTIQRLVPLTQTTSIGNQDNFYPQVVEMAMDVLCMEIQQVSARTGQARGVWETGIVYNYADIVIDGAAGANTGNYYLCVIANTSGNWATDLANGDWALVFNVQSLIQLAVAAAATVLIATSATNSVMIGTGSKTLVTQAGKEFQTGMYLIASDASNSANYILGQVTSYVGTSLVLNATSSAGAGTPAGWNIAVSGPTGLTGPTGPSGSLPTAAATGAANVITATYSPPLTLTDQTICALVLGAAVTITTPTFAPNSLAAHTITARGGQALLTGDMPGATFVALLEYNLANTRWELLNPAAVPTAPVTSVAGKTGAVTLAAGDIAETAWTQASLTNNNQLANGSNFATNGGNITNFVNNAGYISASGYAGLYSYTCYGSPDVFYSAGGTYGLAGLPGAWLAMGQTGSNVVGPCCITGLIWLFQRIA